MPLLLKPHMVLIQSVGQNSQGSLNNSLAYSSGFSARGQMSASDPAATFNKWGLEAERPYKLLLDLPDAEGLKTGDRVVWNSRVFFVKAPPKRSEQGLALDHATVLLEEFI